MQKTAWVVILFLTAPLQASEWALGVTVPQANHASLWYIDSTYIYGLSFRTSGFTWSSDGIEWRFDSSLLVKRSYLFFKIDLNREEYPIKVDFVRTEGAGLIPEIVSSSSNSTYGLTVGPLINWKPLDRFGIIAYSGILFDMDEHHLLVRASRPDVIAYWTF